jgi:hypothetical protein
MTTATAIITRPEGVLARLVEVTIPETEDELRSSMDALGGAINAGGWATAAVVYAWTERQRPGPNRSSSETILGIRDFAALGLRGLASPTTVIRYRAAWEATGLSAERGQTVELPTDDFPRDEYAARRAARGSADPSEVDPTAVTKAEVQEMFSIAIAGDLRVQWQTLIAACSALTLRPPSALLERLEEGPPELVPSTQRLRSEIARIRQYLDSLEEEINR